MDDIRPYRHPGTGLVELPVQWILDDAPHFWFSGADWTKKISTAAEVDCDLARTSSRASGELGGAFVLTMHPQIIGRPGRLGFLDEFVGWVRGHDGVRVATCGEIAAEVP